MEREGHRVIFRRRKKSKTSLKYMEYSWSAKVLKQHYCPLGYSTQYTDKTNPKDAKIGNLLIKEMRVQR